jgi:CRISPR-associated protein Csh2
MGVSSGEILFVKSVKDGIPNRDPLNDSNARRLFGEEDGRVSLSDVSIKRDVRDYVLSRYPQHSDGSGRGTRRFGVFVREARDEKGNLFDRRQLALALLGLPTDSRQRVSITPTQLQDAAFDVRVFGAVFSVADQAFHFTGPVQFGWAHSLHPVETRYVQGTVILSSGEGKEQGTIWTTYLIPFAVFAMPAVVNASLAAQTRMDEADLELLLEALWRGTQQRQARGRGIQQPLFLLHVEYRDPLFRVGYLEEGLRIVPEAEVWRRQPPSAVQEIRLDVSGVAARLAPFRDRIARLRFWREPALELEGLDALEDLGGAAVPLW